MKKGFTLIELLAVIVILAIIVLIAVPIISKVVDKARKGAAEASALNYLDAVEKYVILHDLDSTKYPYDLKNNTFNVSSNTEISFLDIIIPRAKAESTIPSLNSFITVKGDKPKSGTITLNEKGKVTEAELGFGKYTTECTSGKCVATKEKTSIVIDGEGELLIKMGSTLNLTVTTNSNKTITWESSDDTIATVSDGTITGLKPGNVEITASINKIKDSIQITVVGVPTKDLSKIKSSANVVQNGVKGVVYLNPSDLTSYCTASNSKIGSGTTGCMKWYIFDDSSNKYKLILDHNTAQNIAWTSYRSSLNLLGWDSRLGVRLISTSEINAITGGAPGFNVNNSFSGYYFDTNSAARGYLVKEKVNMLGYLTIHIIV